MSSDPRRGSCMRLFLELEATGEAESYYGPKQYAGRRREARRLGFVSPMQVARRSISTWRRYSAAIWNLASGKAQRVSWLRPHRRGRWRPGGDPRGSPGRRPRRRSSRHRDRRCRTRSRRSPAQDPSAARERSSRPVIPGTSTKRGKRHRAGREILERCLAGRTCSRKS